MGDSQTPGDPTPDGRAPWERYFNESGQPIDTDSPRSRSTRRRGSNERPWWSALKREDKSAAPGRVNRRDAVSVSDLVDKVSGRPARGDIDDPTETIPKVTDTNDPSTGSHRASNKPAPERRPAPPRAPQVSVTKPAAKTAATGRTEPAAPAAAAHVPRPFIPVAESAPIPLPPFTPPATAPASDSARIIGGTPATAGPVVVGTPGKNSTPLTRLALSKQRRRKRVRVIGRTLTALVAVMALTLTGLVWAYLRSTDNAFAQVAALDEDSTDVVDPIGQTGDETYLIVGTDTRAGANSEVGAGTVEDAEGARSDTVMLVNIPANRERVVAVSFPRDLDVQRPVCQGWDNDTGKYTNETFPAADGDKLNATYALGGPKCLVKVIQKMSGLKIGHFVGMDFSGFESMVNEVGGVEVCTTLPLNDYELGPILTQTGRQTIDGKTALNYVRARNIESEGNGDYGRIKRQQRFLSSLLRSALSNKVLLDPGKLNGFINAFTRDTFVEKVTTKDLVTLGRSLQNVDAGAVTFLTIPTAGTTEWGNEIPRDDDIDAIFKSIIDDDPLPGEERSSNGDSTTSGTSTTTPPSSTAGTPTPLLAVEPSEVTLQISNASGMSGLAASTATSLGAYGFGIYSVGNYSGTSTSSVVRYSAGHESDAATVASAVPGAVLEETADLGSIVEVVIGSEFAGSIKAPTPSGSPLTRVATQPSSSSAPVLPADLDVTNAGDDSCS